MYMTNYFESLVLNAFRGQTAAAPTALYMALYLSNPGESGSAGVEVSYAGYQRQPVQFSAPAPMNGGIGVENTQVVSFPLSAVPVGTVTHLAVSDSLTGGNMLLYGPFTESITMGAQESPEVVAGEAQWWLTGTLSTAYKTKVLNLLHGQPLTGFTPYLALFNGSPESGGGELSGAGYARVPVTLTAPEEQVGGQLKAQNALAVVTPRAGEPWGTCAYFALMDAQTVGQAAEYVAANPAREVRKSLMITIAEGDLTLSVN